MGLTAAFTVLSGAGTSCVALVAEKYGQKMAPIVPYKWLYLIFVLVTIAIGVLGIRATSLLIKGKTGAYRSSLLTLVLGILVGGIHMEVSRYLRGSSMPVDAVVYTTALTLIVFLLLRITAVWVGVNFENPVEGKDRGRKTSAITIVICGMLIPTIQVWMGPSHTWDGINWADAWHSVMTWTGWVIVLLGAGIGFISSFTHLSEKKHMHREPGKSWNPSNPS